MDLITKELIWNQFGAALDTLENAINSCPDENWIDDTSYHQIWYMASHTLFWIDYYLTEDRENFHPPKPFGMEEMDPAGVIPDPPYTKDELLTYLEYNRNKSREFIKNLTEKKANELFEFGRVSLTYSRLVLYVLRHIQHHSAQINLLLRQQTNSAPGWVFESKVGLDGEVI